MKDMYTTSDGEMSEWNEALLKMKRLHELQTEINRCSINPLLKHPLINEYNFIIWFRSLCALYSEGNAKYKKEEVEELNQMKSVIEDFMDSLPIVQNKKEANGKVKTVTNKKNWKLLKATIERFEYKVRLYNDKHGLSTKNKENMDGRSILR
jgi:hypothetical protein